MMRCKQVRALLSAYDSDELSVTERSMVERHLAGCADCWSALAAYRALRRQFSLLEHVAVDTEITEETISRIRAQGLEREKQPKHRRFLTHFWQRIRPIFAIRHRTG